MDKSVSSTLNTVTLQNGEVELSVGADFGPRILFYGFRGGSNVLGEAPDVGIDTPAGAWRAHGGHRLWSAPESADSYAPDEAAPQIERDGERALLLRGADSRPFRKEMEIRLDETGTGVEIVHRLTNGGARPVRVACWALTIVRPGTAILPQEPYRSWDEDFLPVRPLVLWSYTDLSDPRYRFGRELVRVRVDASLDTPQKIGAQNRRGWLASLSEGVLFVKRFAWNEKGAYPDYGSNAEIYVKGNFLEIESLGPLETLEPGASATHLERWSLSDGVRDDDASIVSAASRISN